MFLSFTDRYAHSGSVPTRLANLNTWPC